MTIAAGFLCSDGVLICADSEESYTSLKGTVPKIDVIRKRDVTVAITGAGDAGWLEYLSQRIADVVRHRMSPDELEAELQAVLHRVYAEHMTPLGHHDSVELIIGCRVVRRRRFEGKRREFPQCFLFKNNRSALIRVKDSAITGTQGAEFARSIQARLPQPEAEVGMWSLSLALLVAAAMLWHTKRSVQGCGGPSRIVVITRETGAIDFPDQETAQIEAVVSAYEEMSNFMLGILAGAQDTWTDEGLVRPFRPIYKAIKAQPIAAFRKRLNLILMPTDAKHAIMEMFETGELPQRKARRREIKFLLNKGQSKAKE